MAQGVFAQRIQRHRMAARRFRTLSRMRHLRAARLGKRSLLAQARGHHVRAARLLKRAFALKAAAGRARVRALNHTRAIVRVRHARRLWVQRNAAR